jgi:threonine synthase
MQLASTRNPALRVSFAEAVESNLPQDGGLYMPASLAPFPDVAELLALRWGARARELLARLLGPELSRAETDALADGAFDFPVPWVELGAPDGSAATEIAALELFHGPTLSFKDFGVRFLARVLALLRERARSTPTRTVLTATSGDTGAAVGAGVLASAGLSRRRALPARTRLAAPGAPVRDSG